MDEMDSNNCKIIATMSNGTIKTLCDTKENISKCESLSEKISKKLESPNPSIHNSPSMRLALPPDSVKLRDCDCNYMIYQNVEERLLLKYFHFFLQCLLKIFISNLKWSILSWIINNSRWQELQKWNSRAEYHCQQLFWPWQRYDEVNNCFTRSWSTESPGSCQGQVSSWF